MPSRPFARERLFGDEPFASFRCEGVDVITGLAAESLRDTGPEHVFWDNATQVGAELMTDGNSALDSSGNYTTPLGVDHIKLVYSAMNRHTSSEWNYFPFFGIAYTTINGAAPFRRGPGVISSRHEGLCPQPPTSVVTSFSLQAMKAMLSQFPPEVSILNYLYELKDLVGTIQSIAGFFQSFSEVLQGTFHGSIKQASDLWLEWNFGMSPLLGDTAKLVNTFRRVRDRLDWLKRNRGKRVRVGYRMSYTDPFEEDVFLAGIGATTGPSIVQFRSSVSGKLTASAWVRQNLPWLDSWLGFVRGVIGDGGFNRPLSVIWEALPFSWLVDYFLPIGDFLESVVFEDIKDWEVSNFTWSFKTRYGYQLRAFSAQGDELPLVGEYAWVRYRRYRTFPPRDWYIKYISAKQASLLAAIGHSNSG